jgi:hypothetical protein
VRKFAHPSFSEILNSSAGPLSFYGKIVRIFLLLKMANLITSAGQKIAAPGRSQHLPGRDNDAP